MASGNRILVTATIAIALQMLVAPYSVKATPLDNLDDAKRELAGQVAKMETSKQVSNEQMRKIKDLVDAAGKIEKEFAKQYPDSSRQALLPMYALLDRQIANISGQKPNFGDELVGASRNNSEKDIAAGPLDNRIYLIRFKIDTALTYATLSKEQAGFFSDEIERLKQLEDLWSDENGKINKVDRQTITYMIDLLEHDLKPRINHGGTIHIAGKKQMKTLFRKTPVTAQYKWYPSRFGGYYDATGQINGRFTPEDISRYGGVIHNESMTSHKGSGQT